MDAGFQFVTRRRDERRRATWTALGHALPHDFIATTLEVARSDPRRIYVGGVVGTSVGRGRDERGSRSDVTRTALPTATPIASVRQRDRPARRKSALVRIMSSPVDAFGMAPTALHVTHDIGATWSDVAHTEDSMLGFALSPDGTLLAYGGQQEGVYVGPSDGSAPFEQMSGLKNRCLTWTPEGLYACGTEPIDPFGVGRSTDMGRSYEALYKVADTCPQTCPHRRSFSTKYVGRRGPTPQRNSDRDGRHRGNLLGAVGESFSGRRGNGRRSARRAGALAMKPDSAPRASRPAVAHAKCCTSNRSRETTLGAVGLCLAWGRRRRRVSQRGGAGS